jgi:hypothetical protein
LNNHSCLLAALALLPACSAEPAPEPIKASEAREMRAPAPPERQPAPMPSEPILSWESVSSGAGTALRLTGPDGMLQLSIACLAHPPLLSVTVPGFEPVMSEDKFVLGLGDEPIVLVADPYEQEPRAGVTGEGPIPADFAALLREATEVSALYGYQKTATLPAPPADQRELLGRVCGQGG